MRGHRSRFFFVMLGALVACDDGSSGDARGVDASPPETFFAVRDHSTKVVELETETGRVRRTVVDLGYTEPPGDTDSNAYIRSIDLGPGRRTLYYSVGYTGPLYRVVLPDGEPERIADGQGVAVSPDGQRLAFVRASDLVVRELPGGQEQVFDDLIGELGGRAGSWADDSRHLAVETDGADVTVVQTIDTRTGETIELQPKGSDPDHYYAHSPRFRRSDGLLAVLCCIIPDVPPDNPPPSRDLVVHDPATGREKERVTLPFTTSDHDYDPSGKHQLLRSRDAVHRRSNGKLIPVPDTEDVSLVAW